MNLDSTNSFFSQHRTDGAPLAPNWPLALLEEIECGLILCDGNGRLRFANQAAQRELATQRLLLLQGSTLHRASGVTGDLDTALRQAATRDKRTLVRLITSEHRLLVSVQPLPEAAGCEPMVLLMLGRRQPCSELGLEMLATSFGLTLAERRVLAALMREASPRQIAIEHSVSLTTVRTQIASIRAKMDTRTIDGLLLRTAEVPPVSGALRMAMLPSARDARHLLAA